MSDYECTVDIDVLFAGVYVPGRPARHDMLNDRHIPAVHPTVADFKIYKYINHNWLDITHIFEPAELKQRMLEYLDHLEEQRELSRQEVG